MDCGDIDYYFLEDVLNIKIPTKFITPKPKAIENIKLLGDKEMVNQFLQKINDWDEKNYQYYDELLSIYEYDHFTKETSKESD